MTISVDPIIGRSPMQLNVGPTLCTRLAGSAHGRPLVIDYNTSRHRALTVGGLTVRFDASLLEPRYVELEPRPTNRRRPAGVAACVSNDRGSIDRPAVDFVLHGLVAEQTEDDRPGLRLVHALAAQ